MHTDNLAKELSMVRMPALIIKATTDTAGEQKKRILVELCPRAS